MKVDSEVIEKFIHAQNNMLDSVQVNLEDLYKKIKLQKRINEKVISDLAKANMEEQNAVKEEAEPQEKIEEVIPENIIPFPGNK